MATGTVKWFNPQKGFGFITPDDGGKDVFVHITAVERAGMGPLVEGQKINFEVISEPRGLKAVDLSAAEEAAAEAPEAAAEEAAEEAPEEAAEEAAEEAPEE